MIRCVVIGCGWAGMHHLETIVLSNHARLGAVVDADPEKLRMLSEKYGVPAYASLEELIASGTEFDAAVVSTLAPLHKEQCLMLIEAGKHILCEKPVCRSTQDIAFLKECAGKAGTRFGAVFNQRFGDAVQKAKELITEEGDTIHLVTASMYQHWPTKTGGHIDEYFMITDACTHLLDVVTYLCGRVAAVTAVANKVESELYSDVVAALLFENGAVGTFSHTNVGGKLDTQHPFQCIDVHTKKFRLRIENQFDRLIVYRHDDMAQQVYETSVFKRRDYSVSLMRACEGFLNAVDTNTPLPADIDEALVNMRVIDAIKQSITVPKTQV